MIKQFVGEFTKQDLIEGKNIKEVEKLQKIFPKLKYIQSIITKKNTLKIWITDTF